MFPTPCLEALLFLFALMFPSAFVYFVREIPMRRLSAVAREYVPLALTLLVLLLVAVAGGHVEGLRFEVSWLWLAVGVVTGVFNVGLEYLLSALPRLKDGRGWPGLKPTSMYVGAPATAMLLVALSAFLEEMVHRGVIMGALLPALGSPVWLAVPLSALVYAMNHAFFGRGAVILKFASGLALGAVYALSGGLILVPVVAHIVQNGTLFVHARRASRPSQWTRREVTKR